MRDQPPSRTGVSSHLFKSCCTIDEIFLEIGYTLLSNYEFGIQKNGNLLIRPKEARIVLSKIRVSRPVIEKILDKMEKKGLVERNNQFIVLIRMGGGK